MESPTAIQHPVAFNYDVSYHNVVDARFLRELFERDPVVTRGDSWITRATLDEAPGRQLARSSYFHAARQEGLVEIDGVLAHLILNERALVVRVAAKDENAVADALAALKKLSRRYPALIWRWR